MEIYGEIVRYRYGEILGVIGNDSEIQVWERHREIYGEIVRLSYGEI